MLRPSARDKVSENRDLYVLGVHVHLWEIPPVATNVTFPSELLDAGRAIRYCFAASSAATLLYRYKTIVGLGSR
jgi:hypothetical protein